MKFKQNKYAIRAYRYLKTDKEKIMTIILKALIGLCLATTSMGGLAQNADEYKDQHLTGTHSPAMTTKKLSCNSMNAERMESMDKQMNEMQAMHEKMASSKNQEERQTLMSEHMKMMQGGMVMMKETDGMSGMSCMQGGKGMRRNNWANHQHMMEKRMEMMESMMQMLMDRTLSAPSN